MMAIPALFLIVVWLVLITGLRPYLFYRRTGEIPVLVRAEPWSPQWWARLISTLGVGLRSPVPWPSLPAWRPSASWIIPW